MKFKTWLPLIAASTLCFQKPASLPSASVSANQFLDQYPASMRSAIMAIGTHILFQLSSQDADKMAAGAGRWQTPRGNPKEFAAEKSCREIRTPPPQPRCGACL